MSNFLVHKDDLASLETIKNSPSAETLVKRARLLLLLHQGKTTAEVSAEVGLAPSTINKWRRAYLNRRMAIFPAPPDVRPSLAVPPPVKKRVTKVASKKFGKKTKGKKMAKKNKRTVALAKSVKAAIKVLESGKKKKLGGFKKSKSFKKARKSVEQQKDAAFKLLKRINKGKKVSGVKKQIKGLDKRVKAMASLIKKRAKK